MPRKGLAQTAGGRLREIVRADGRQGGSPEIGIALWGGFSSRKGLNPGHFARIELLPGTGGGDRRGDPVAFVSKRSRPLRSLRIMSVP